MFANYDPNPIARRILPQRIRKTLRSADFPIAIRREYIASSKTTLILRPDGDVHSPKAYRITDEDFIPQFTVTGQKFGDRSCREFRDASGLPLFELHRKFSLRNAWVVTLPGSNSANIATAALRLPQGVHMLGNFSFSFENVAAADSKNEEDKFIAFQVERHGNILTTFDVVFADRKVVEIRESIPHNKTLPMSSSKSGYRPVLDITVTEGMDMALVSGIRFLCLVRVD
ncbi:hypothetical protein PHISCL_01239 [Aspergillus sclerotialis]|uniref:Tubby C-terminal-like domain-containing protein n=1 Tax=Aspergillus sclerotialis TaxID=2070753 RepID=A0A3A2ZTE7_9EURO|nr:hypothetical protein PHISCL_01239 [Aspergillus sclerotialis]